MLGGSMVVTLRLGAPSIDLHGSTETPKSETASPEVVSNVVAIAILLPRMV